MTLSLPKRSRGLKECSESVNVCAKLIVSVSRSETLLGKVEVGMLALWPQVRPALVLKGAVFRCFVQTLLKAVWALLLMLLQALLGSVEVRMPERMFEMLAFALRLQVQAMESSDFSENSADASAHATAGVSERNLGLRHVIGSHSRLNSFMGVARVRSASSAVVAPSPAAVALTCPLASGAVVAVHARHTVTPMHVAHNGLDEGVSNHTVVDLGAEG